MKILTPFLVLLAVSACGSLGGIRLVPDQAGEVRLFNGGVRAAALATRNALAAMPLGVVEAQQRGSNTWYFIALWPNGSDKSLTHVRVLCERVEDDVVEIRIVVKAGRDDLDLGATFFALLSLELDVVPKGVPPPVQHHSDPAI
jgi:hypothetical protein